MNRFHARIVRGGGMYGPDVQITLALVDLLRAYFASERQGDIEIDDVKRRPRGGSAPAGRVTTTRVYAYPDCACNHRASLHGSMPGRCHATGCHCLGPVSHSICWRAPLGRRR